MITNALGSAVVPQLEKPGFTALAAICQAHKGIAIYMFEFRHGVTEVIGRNGDSYQLIAPLANGHFTTPGVRVEIALVHGEIRHGFYGSRLRRLKGGPNCIQQVAIQTPGRTLTHISHRNYGDFFLGDHLEIGGIPRAATAVADDHRVAIALDRKSDAPVRVNPVDAMHLTQCMCVQHLTTSLFEQPELPARELAQVCYR